MSNIKPKDNQGFTIIEVLIVLAIAGLILLVVFLAVPALQRSARNTQRKNDAAAALAGVSEYENNNGGITPLAGNVNGSVITYCDANPCSANVAQATAKLGYYTSNTYKLQTTYTAAPNPAVDQLWIEIGAGCTSQTQISASTSTRAIAALYAIETGGGLVWQCVAS